MAVLRRFHAPARAGRRWRPRTYWQVWLAVTALPLAVLILGVGLRLVVFPHVLGQAGQEPVFTGYPETSLTLASTSVLDSRLVVCEYRPNTPA